MAVFLFLLTATTLSFIAWQDFRSRAVTWFLFPLLAGCGVALAFRETASISQQAKNILFNSGFLLLQFAALKAWFLLRKSRTPLIDHAIGKGDLFFLLAAGCFFSPINFILFYLSSLLFALLSFLVMRVLPARTGRPSTIPLAGLQAGLLLLCLTMPLLMQLQLTDDQWIVQKLLSS